MDKYKIFKTIKIFQDKFNETQNSNIQLLLVTSAGMITGKVSKITTVQNFEEKIETDGIIEMSLLFKTHLDIENEDQSILDNYLLLKDAKLYSQTTKEIVQIFPELTIFVDQILGFCLIPEQKRQDYRI